MRFEDTYSCNFVTLTGHLFRPHPLPTTCASCESTTSVIMYRCACALGHSVPASHPSRPSSLFRSFRYFHLSATTSLACSSTCRRQPIGRFTEDSVEAAMDGKLRCGRQDGRIDMQGRMSVGVRAVRPPAGAIPNDIHVLDINPAPTQKFWVSRKTYEYGY